MGSTNHIHQLRIIDHVPAEEHRKTTEDKVMLTSARSVGRQGTKKGRAFDAVKLDSHAASIDPPVALRPAVTIEEPDNGRIVFARADQARRELARSTVAHEDF